jgi:hypothetical protein
LPRDVTACQLHRDVDRGVLGDFVCVFGSVLLFVLPSSVYSLKGMGSFLPRYISVMLMLCFSFEFCYGVYNKYELFICLDLIVKNRKINIKMYFK